MKERKEYQLRAAAAKSCIDPDEETIRLVDLEGRYDYDGIDDSVYVRVILLEAGEEKLLILSSDLSTFPVTEELFEEIGNKWGIDRERIFAGGTRSHNTISLRKKDHYDDYPEGSRRYVRFVHGKTLECIEKCVRDLQPARIGSAEGRSGISTCRELQTPIGTLESQNHAADGAFRLPVVRIEDLNGKTIAVLVNYSMHCCLFCWNSIIGEYKKITGDVAGAVSRYVERWGKEEFPVAWICGGGTDRQPTVYSRLDRCEVNEKGEFYHVREILPIAGSRMLMRSYAAEQGLDIIRTIGSISEYSDRVSLSSVSSEAVLPSRTGFEEQIKRQMTFKDIDPVYRPGMDVTPVPGKDNVHFRYALTVLGDIAFAGVNGSPYSAFIPELQQKLQRELGIRNLVFFDDCHGYVSSIPRPECETENIYGHSTMQCRCMSAADAAAAFEENFEELIRKV